MKKLILAIGTIFLTSFSIINVNAQSDNNTAAHTVGISVSEVALIDIESSTGSSITLDPNLPTEAGDPINFTGVTNNDLYLNYSSIVSSGEKRTISASLDSDFPAGISLQVIAADAVPSAGKGNLGQAKTSVSTLSSSSVTVIDNIGSCYTGNGDGKGSNLTYSVVVNDSDYGLIIQNGYSGTVTYTISDN